MDHENTAKRLLFQLRGQEGGQALALAEAPGSSGEVTLSAALLQPGEVVELCARPGTGVLSLAFHLVKALYEARRAQAPWLCALQSEAELLSVPALLQLGIPLTRLLVLSPPASRTSHLGRLAVRVIRSGNFAGIIVDATALSSLEDWPVAIRRLGLAARTHGTAVFVLTHPDARRPLALPTAARAHCRAEEAGLSVTLVKHRGGFTGRQFLVPHLLTHPALRRPAMKAT
jgi:hypothetical protein